jgi:hypothetical protein
MQPTRFAQLTYAEHGRRRGLGMADEELEEWLDSSKVALLHLCPQKFYYRHELGLVPKGDEFSEATSPANYGFALHKALESLYDGSGFEKQTCPCPTFEGCEFCNGLPIARTLAQFLIHYPWDPEDDKDPRTRLRALQILTAYISKWRNDQFDVIAVEVPFTIPFAEFNFIGRIDLIGKWKDSNRIFPNDHKSTTRFGDMFDMQFKLSLQMGIYIIAVELITKEPCDEGQVNAFRVTTKIDEDSFKRIITTRTPEEKERCLQEIRSAYEHIKHYRAIDFWPRHAPFACSAYFRRCEYYSLCTSGAQTQRELIETSYEVKPWTPLPE